MINHLKWSFISQTTCSFLSIGFTIGIMNVLLPEDYGLMGMILPIYAFCGLVSNFALDRSIITRKSIDTTDLTTLFWSKLILASAISVLLILAMPIIIQFYQEQRLETIILWLAFGLIIQSSLDIYKGILYRRFSFKALAIGEILAIGISGGFGLLLAIRGYGFHALIAKEIIGLAVLLSILVFVSGWVPTLSLQLKRMRSFWQFGKNITLARMMNYFSRNLDDILVGRKFGSSALGLYSKSYTLLTLPLTLISKTFVTATLPSMRKYLDKQEEANTLFLKVVRSVMGINSLLCIVLYHCADALVEMLLDENWIGTVPLIRIFCLLGVFQAIGPLSDLVYEGMNHSDKIVKYTLVGHVITIFAIVLGFVVGRSVYELAIFYAVGNFSTFFTNQFFIGRMTGIPIRRLLKNVTPFFILSAAIFFLGFMIENYINTEGSLITIIAYTFILTIAYFGLMRILFLENFNELVKGFYLLATSVKG